MQRCFTIQVAPKETRSKEFYNFMQKEMANTIGQYMAMGLRRVLYDAWSRRVRAGNMAGGLPRLEHTAPLEVGTGWFGCQAPACWRAVREGHS
ncbi:hypothetical protein ACFX19_020401 [Malus domestica]